MPDSTAPTIAEDLAAEDSRLYLQILTHQRISGRVLTADEAREVHELADRSLTRGKR